MRKIRSEILSQDEVDSLLGCDGEEDRGGKKFDAGKARWDLLPMDALAEIVAVYTYGARKYDDQNWRKGISYSRIIGAILRHFTSFCLREEKDPESGLPHLAHAGWGILTLIWYCKHRREFDDRYKI